MSSRRVGGAASRGPRWRPIVVAFAAAVAVGVLGGLSTDIGPWYLALKEPPWKPPDFLFGPAWTTIYACAAVAGVIGWRRADSTARRTGMLKLFALNAFANVLWSGLFFRLRRPDWALIEVGLLWITILLLIVYFARYSRPSAWLLAPYLVWVSFAAALNLAVVRLNAPFGT